MVKCHKYKGKKKKACLGAKKWGSLENIKIKTVSELGEGFK